MINQKNNNENSERIFNISYTCKYRQNLLIKTKKKREKKLKNRRANSLSEITKKFLHILLEEKKDIINLKEIIPKIKVKKRRIYDITNVFFFVAINLIKKKSKNNIQILNNFHYLYQNENIIDLQENGNYTTNNKIELSNKKKLNEIAQESKEVDYLIKIVNDKLSDQNEEEIEKGNKYDNISLVQSDLIPLVPDLNNYTNLMLIKSESGIKVEDLLIDETRNKEQKKCEMYMGKMNEKNMDISSYSNKSWIISNNNTSLKIFNIDLKKEVNENTLSNNNKGENKLEEEAANNLFIGERKDSIISSFSSLGNISNYSI